MAAIAHEWLDWAKAQAQARLTLDISGVRATLPPRSFFKFPPANLPPTLPHPTESPNYELLFNIPSHWYNAALSPAVPITFALVYATVVTYLNSVNKRRGYKPWAISKTRSFKLFVLSHNIFLSAYSLWTFIGMVKALRATVANPREYGLAGTVDSLCKMNGPRGLGSAATYNETTSTWGLTDRLMHLAADGLTPDATDVGRLWNEGLAFYGWLFYLSKFYEVVDTLIIIAKGKKSSFLQTYHHAGAMLCMWAGIRYMSPPIWMFVTENSFIHFIMYTFYTSTTLGIRVPKWMKQTLTTMQISQFVLGITFAFAHYFVSYQVPISVPYIYHFGESVTSAASAVKTDVSSALSVATATASADVGSWLKKLALRAAGREGLAENVENRLGQTFGVNVTQAVEDFVHRQETRYRNEVRWVHCLDTSGQTFAIYLNLFYLVPLTGLFVQFFIKSYLKRADQQRRGSVGQVAYIAGQSINDARKGVGRRLSETFEDYQGANGDTNGDGPTVSNEEIHKELVGFAKRTQQKGREVFESVSEKVSEIDSQKVTQQVQRTLEQVTNKAQELTDKAGESIQQVVSNTENKVESPSKTPGTPGSAKKSVENVTSEDFTNNAADTAEKVKEEAEALASDAVKRMEELGESVKDEAEEDGQGNSRSSLEESGELVIEETSWMGEENSSKGENTRDGAADAESHGDSAQPKTPEHDVTVKEGKSFADAAAKGVAEEDKGETRVVDDSKDVAGDRQEIDEDDSETGPGSLTRKISDAMSGDIADSPHSYLSRSQSSNLDAESVTSPATTPSKRHWHNKRRGRSWSSDLIGKGEPAIGSSPVTVGRYHDPESPTKQDTDGHD